MFLKTGFTYNGIHSDTYNCILASFGTNNEDTPFGFGGQSILEETINGENEPLLYGIHRNPLTITLTLYSADVWTKAKRMQVASWLLEKTYKPLISDDDTSIVYYCMCVDSPKKIMYGNEIRGIELTFRCNSAYAYTATTTLIDTVTGSKTITIDTRTSNYKEPYKDLEIEFTLVGANTALSIVNTTDANRTLSFSGLTALETIYINQKKKQILSSLGLERVSKSNLTWLRLMPNVVNSLTVTGSCSITFRYKLPLIL